MRAAPVGVDVGQLHALNLTVRLLTTARRAVHVIYITGMQPGVTDLVTRHVA